MERERRNLSLWASTPSQALYWEMWHLISLALHNEGASWLPGVKRCALGHTAEPERVRGGDLRGDRRALNQDLTRKDREDRRNHSWPTGVARPRWGRRARECGCSRLGRIWVTLRAVNWNSKKTKKGQNRAGRAGGRTCLQHRSTLKDPSGTPSWGWSPPSPAASPQS